MKKLINLYLGWIQDSASFKILLSIVLFMTFGVLFNGTGKQIYLWLLIIPGSFLVPFILTSFVEVWIVKPITWIINKIKGI